MAITLDLGILAAACALFYIGARALGSGEKELIYTQYIQIISKWLFMFAVLVMSFELMSVYGKGGTTSVVTSMTSNVPLYCTGANLLTQCGTTNQTTVTTVSGPAMPELTDLFIAVLALWLMMFILDMVTLIPKLTNALKVRLKK